MDLMTFYCSGCCGTIGLTPINFSLLHLLFLKRGYFLHFLLLLLLSDYQIILVAEGIDTISVVSVNGIVVGTTDNMFRRYLRTEMFAFLWLQRYEFDIAGVVTAGSNVIKVAFTSAATYAQVTSTLVYNSNLNLTWTRNALLPYHIKFHSSMLSVKLPTATWSAKNRYFITTLNHTNK